MWPRAKLRHPFSILGRAFFSEQLVSVNRHILPAEHHACCVTAPEHIITGHTPVALQGYFFLSELSFWEMHHLSCTLVTGLPLITAPRIYSEVKKTKLKMCICLFKIYALANLENVKSFLSY